MHFILVQNGLNPLLVLHLNHHSGILAEEDLYQVVFLKGGQIDGYTIILIGKTHFEQGGHQSPRRDVVTGQHQSLLNHFLQGSKTILKVVAVHHRGRLIAQLVQYLGKTAAAERSEEHTSELQSRPHLVCRLLLEKKKKE